MHGALQSDACSCSVHALLGQSNEMSRGGQALRVVLGANLFTTLYTLFGKSLLVSYIRWKAPSQLKLKTSALANATQLPGQALTQRSHGRPTHGSPQSVDPYFLQRL